MARGGGSKLAGVRSGNEERLPNVYSRFGSQFANCFSFLFVSLLRYIWAEQPKYGLKIRFVITTIDLFDKRRGPGGRNTNHPVIGCNPKKKKYLKQWY